MKDRIISAIVALLITVPLLLLGGIYFEVLVVILGLIAMWELMRLRNVPKMMKYISYVLFFCMLMFGYSYTGKLYIVNFTFVILIILFLFLPILYYNNTKKYNIEDIFYLFSSIIFLSSAFNLFIKVRSFGLFLTIYLLLISTMTDTFAYFIGSKYGKRKLFPKISPKKSLEGFIGGLIFGSLISTIFYVLVIGNVSIISIFVLSVLLSIIGQFGDLAFSYIKRYFNIKDFSNIMPGHGGILDRLDSIIFILFGYVIFSIFI